MKAVYAIAGLSKQAFHQNKKHIEKEDVYVEHLCMQADEIRAIHPKIGVRKMYDMVLPEKIGRDKFEKILLNSGYRVYYPRNYVRTTYSVKCYQYTNHIKGIELTDVNQIWQSDITYFWTGNRFYYLVFIIDVYSRRIIGYNASTTLATTANLNALKMAFKMRKKVKYKGLIHHSDRGSQYASNVYTSLLESKECTISMCDAAYENAYAERVNGIIKNEYMSNWTFNNLSDVEKGLRRAVEAYNNSRPHQSHGNKYSPTSFEEYVLTLKAEKRPKVKLYTEGQKQEVNHE
jgi:transposase InsO family protein